jgi:hypothetical protein
VEQVLAQTLAAPALRKKLGDNGRRRFLESFTFDRMLAKTMQVYQQALGAQTVRVPAATPIPIAGSSRTRLG